MKLGTVVLAVSLLFQASAQERSRQGWFIGLGGGVSCLMFETNWAPNGVQLGGSLPNFHVGKMLDAESAVVLNLPGTIYRFKGIGRERDRGFEGIVPTFQIWPLKRFWLQLGAGLGMDAPAFYDIQGEDERRFVFGPAVLAGSGMEVISRDFFSLDLSARYMWAKTLLGSEKGEATVPLLKGHAVSILISSRFYLHKRKGNHE